SRTPASPTQTIRVPARDASVTAAWLMRAPSSSITQARPPTGTWVRMPILSTTTKAPSRTSTLPFSMKMIDARSFSRIDLSMQAACKFDFKFYVRFQIDSTLDVRRTVIDQRLDPITTKHLEQGDNACGKKTGKYFL